MKANGKNKMKNINPNYVVPGSDGQMPILGYNGPHSTLERTDWGFDKNVSFTTPNYLQERYFQLIADCGINLMTMFQHDYSKRPADFYQALEWSEKYNLRLFVNDHALSAEMSEEELTARIGEYGSYKAFAGVHVIDEPCIDGFPENFDGTQKLPFEPMPKYAALMRRLHNYDNMTGYINLLPIYHWMNCTADDYRKYLTEFLETCNPRVISFDHYLFEDRNLKRELKWFFINLSVVCEYSKKSGIPFWAFAQCGHQWNFGFSKMETDTYLPTKQQFFWIVNTNLAFGAKGIQYFPIVQEYQCALYLDGGLDCDRSAILGADGEPTMWHGFVRQSNKQVKAVGSILMQCELQGVLALKDAKLYCEGLYPVLDAENYKELTSVQCRKSGVFIGCFDYQGKTALYVVNNDTKKCQNVKLNFDNIYQVKLISDVGEREEETNSCKITLGAGKAMLVIL